MKKTLKIDALVLLFSLIICAQILTYIVPQGSFDRRPSSSNPDRAQVVPGTYQRLTPADQVDLPIGYFLSAVTKGMSEAQSIIFLIFISGGVIAVIRQTGAIDAFLMAAVHKFGEKLPLLIIGCLLIFGLGSYTIGMGEEYIPLIPLLVSICLALKLDALMAVALVMLPWGIGWATAGINPFGLMIAQSIAGVPLGEGWEIRLLMFFTFIGLAFHHAYAYVRKIRQTPEHSYVSHIDFSHYVDQSVHIELTQKKLIIMMCLLGGILLFVWGALTHGWYITELNSIFLCVGILAGVIGRLSPSQVSESFIKGAGQMVGPALMVGFARAISVTLTDGQILDTVVESLANMLQGLPSEVTAIGMLAVQSSLNLLIPSGSSQAFVSMPIMSPLATITGIPQQTAILAYQFGDGFTNILFPTSSVLMAALAIAKVPYTAWLKFIVPLMVKIMLLACAYLVLSIHFPI